MLIRPDCKIAADLSYEFAMRVANSITIGGAVFDAVDMQTRDNFPGMHTTHLLSQRMTASVASCLMPKFGNHLGHYTQALRSWKEKMHEAARRADQRKPAPGHRTDMIWTTFDRLNPKGHVVIQTRCDLVHPPSPFNVSGEREIRCVITATAPMARRGKPVEFLRKQLLILERAATPDGMKSLAEHYASFFGPDYEKEIP